MIRPTAKSLIGTLDGDHRKEWDSIHTSLDCCYSPEMGIEEMVDMIFECGAVPALFQHLQEPQWPYEVVPGLRPYEHEVEKASSSTLVGLLAIKLWPCKWKLSSY